MLNIEVLDFTATTAHPATTNEMEILMRKTANNIRTTEHKAERNAATREARTKTARKSALNARQYDFRRGGYRR
ncbi:hypothetical protein [Phytomonospora endophytica]|uniref:Uncharacterized protein n=1 Tax=Phytomonospora endophytica TaxID=714109 RepID=A0A841FRS0_9ACTN|nr:hypothetical protein [Phytomonospora endophytica]MBB6038945.1 hypothetical protein [Phytomonospora endophytica]GIG67953.1 hypothetical protein Pen01_42480 [Phytomonospora endophytica]